VDRFHRYYQLDSLLKARRHPVPRREIERALECSRATAKRVIDEMRNYGEPIDYVRTPGGYRYDRNAAFELPGLWFTPSELLALLAAHQLLSQAEPGLLADTLKPLRSKAERLLKAEHLGGGELARRVRLIRMAGRGAGASFQPAVTALSQRKRLSILYQARKDDTETRRIVSPQRLIHYRDNWYLDAWCHRRRALRSFALERIRKAKVLGQAAREFPEGELDSHFAAAYGIFSGHPRHEAVLHFSAERARWVAEEQWHPKQVGQWLTDGRYELRVPYGDARELVMDILKHGEHVEVMAPDDLRAEVAAGLKAALGKYSVGLTD
jgi:predicted DNA-binding transcriptional regulator YafY